MSSDNLPGLPEGWAWTTLEQLLDRIEAGKSPKAENRPAGEGEYGVLKVSAMSWGEFLPEENKVLRSHNPPSSALTVKAGDLLFSRANTVELVGAVVLVPRDYPNLVLSDKSLRLVPATNEVLNKWLLYALRGSKARKHLEQAATGTSDSMRNVSQEKLRQTPIPLAPLAEQRRIVEAIEALFSKLDAGVAALKDAQRGVRRYKASVLKAACEGRLVPQDPTDEPASALLRHIRAERRAKWQGKGKYQEPAGPDTAGLPELPEGWVWATWEQVGFSQNGRSFPSREYQDSGIKLLRPGNLHANGRVVWTADNTRYMPDSWGHDYPNFIIGPEELVMNLTAQSLKDEFLGRVCLTGPDEYCLLNQRIARLTPIAVNPQYLLWMFKSQVFRSFVNELNTGSLIQHMFTSQLAQFCLPLPPLAEQQRIVAEVERRLSVAAALEQSIAATLKRAARLRQAILKRAFSGQLVPQNPTDEPARVLLARIRREKAKGAKGKQLGLEVDI